MNRCTNQPAVNIDEMIDEKREDMDREAAWLIYYEKLKGEGITKLKYDGVETHLISE
jgi:hypothetical protein